MSLNLEKGCIVIRGQRSEVGSRKSEIIGQTFALLVIPHYLGQD